MRGKYLIKNKTTETHITTILFILQHHLHHLIIGFGMSSKSSFLTALWKKLSEDEAYSLDDKYTSLSPFHSLSDNFDMDSHDF